jgi:hypothetical protein
MTSYTTTQQLPSKKFNHFTVIDKETNNKINVPYLTQNELSEYWIQIMPRHKKKSDFNHFNITLAYLPEHLWYKLRKNHKSINDNYKSIEDGITKYTINETNQDELMISLFKEIHRYCPRVEVIKNLIDELDDSLYSSWLVLRARTYL